MVCFGRDYRHCALGTGPALSSSGKRWMNDTERRRMAREGMDRGDVPRVNPQGIWVHTGTRAQCAVCRVAITESDTGYEVEFTPRLVSFWFHRACFAAWLDERAQP
jgi:hypothetical protein